MIISPIPSTAVDPHGSSIGADNISGERTASTAAPRPRPTQEVLTVDNTTLFGDGDDQPDPDDYVMRSPCRRCESKFGRRTQSGGQDVVRCKTCGLFAYNAPKAETGTPQQSVSSRPQIKPSLRARILERDNYRCFLCGATAEETHLQISHMISVKDGRRHGMTDAQLWSYYNLATWCDECNLGQSGRSVNTWLQFRAFLIWDSDYPQ